MLKYSGLEGRRLILSLPYWLGMIQAFFLEKTAREQSDTHPRPGQSAIPSI